MSNPCSSSAEKMLQMGFTLKEIQESLSENRYDEVCATYMLLQRDVKEVRRSWHEMGREQSACEL